MRGAALCTLLVLNGCATSRVERVWFDHGSIHVNARSEVDADEKIDIDVWHGDERVVGGVGTNCEEFEVSSGFEEGVRLDIHVRYFAADDRLNAERRWSVLAPLCQERP